VDILAYMVINFEKMFFLSQKIQLHLDYIEHVSIKCNNMYTMAWFLSSHFQSYSGTLTFETWKFMYKKF